MHKLVLAGLFATVVLASPPALARGNLDAASLNALKNYSLSMDKIEALGAAYAEMARVPGLKDKSSHVGDNAKTLAEMEARLTSLPEAMAIFKKHGLTAHDAVTMPFALMDAGMVAAYPAAATRLSDRTSAAQIAFYKAHEAELKKLGWLHG
ncbi:MAG: hypothetical protein JO348_14270 [Alphaproteobacteria bacterium]|nr:hypothetical protein [Alphaproteobacteria bacterium]MBV9420931.1 hypothetical protein [Alphaproteobacteria bacterium]